MINFDKHSRACVTALLLCLVAAALLLFVPAGQPLHAQGNNANARPAQQTAAATPRASSWTSDRREIRARGVEHEEGAVRRQCRRAGGGAAR